jgi:hypothetical protein
MSSSLAPLAKPGQPTPGRTRRPARILAPATALRIMDEGAADIEPRPEPITEDIQPNIAAAAETAPPLEEPVTAIETVSEAVPADDFVDVAPDAEPVDTTPTSQPPAAAPSNQRKAPRKPTVTPAGVLHETIKVPLPCRIKDMSATGACLVFPQTVRAVFPDPDTLPNELTLVLRADRLEVDCVVVRRRGEELGVRFTSVHRPLRKIVEAEPMAGSRRTR